MALNMVHQPRTCAWQGRGTLLLSTYLDGEDRPIAGPTLLRPDEGMVVKLHA